MVFKFVTFLLIILFFSGCCNQDDLKLTAIGKSWLPASASSETTFQSQAGQTITFKSNSREYNQQSTDKVCGTYEIESREIILTTETEPNFRVQLVLSHEVLLSIRSFSTAPAAGNINIQFNTVSEQFVSDPFRDRYLKEIDLNSRKYNQVLHIYGDPVAGDIAFAEIYYAQRIGLVGFKTFAGEWYYLK